MTDGSEKHNRQLAFKPQNSHVCEKRSNEEEKQVDKKEKPKESLHLTVKIARRSNYNIDLRNFA